ncbi:type VI secretion system contractile sheath small subunit [Pseudomonas sp. ChxA]|uniref:type VI secretion system contractile sheath small subunit n=1 Tax=Pseudomonas sp. ChxA TaxID=3035473 RepID=UPI003319B23E
MPEDLLLIPTPKLDRLMALRDALVALKGPLANDSALQENLHRQLFNDEANSRVLGRISTPLPQPTHRITYGEDH